MRDSLGAPGATGQEMLDKQFVRTAAEGSIADIKLSTLAVEKGSPAVKELAQKLVDDHMAMNKEMGSVADAMGVMLPRKIGKDQQREFDKLSGLSGKDFDTEYLTYMVTAHYTDLHNFHMEASTAQNQELAAEVVKGIGMMHAHLGLISSTAKEEGIVLPPRPQRPVATTASK
jgi:putative membrane protein